MFSTLIFRPVLNRNGYVSKDGLRTIVISIYMTGTGERATVNTHIRVRPADFARGKVQDSDPNHDILNRKVTRRVRKLMEYEDELEQGGIYPTPRKVKEAYMSKSSKTSTVREFVDNVVVNSSKRCKSTRQGYVSLCKSIDDYRPATRLDEVSYDFIERFRDHLRDTGLSENTVIGRMKLLRSVISEALKRNVVTDDPFKNITIGHMKPKVAWLTLSEIARIERLPLEGVQEKVRDLWLFGVYSGLRWGDLSTLEEAEIRNGVLRKTMHKTENQVVVPIKTLFWGKGMKILERYPDITVLSHCVGCNSTANKIIKEVAARARIKKKISFHTARKSTASNLALLGMPLQEISSILGHTKSDVTQKYYLFSKEQSLVKTSKKMFRHRDPK